MNHLYLITEQPKCFGWRQHYELLCTDCARALKQEVYSLHNEGKVNKGCERCGKGHEEQTSSKVETSAAPSR